MSSAAQSNDRRASDVNFRRDGVFAAFEQLVVHTDCTPSSSPLLERLRVHTFLDALLRDERSDQLYSVLCNDATLLRKVCTAFAVHLDPILQFDTSSRQTSSQRLSDRLRFVTAATAEISNARFVLDALAWRERSLEVASSVMDTINDDADNASPSTPPQPLQDDHFARFKARVYCDYSARECLTLLLFRQYAREFGRRHAREEDARVKLQTQRLTQATALRDALLHKFTNLRVALERETALYHDTMERVRELRNQTNVLSAQLQLERDRVDRQTQLAVNKIANSIRENVKRLAAERNDKLAVLRARVQVLTDKRDVSVSAICKMLRQLRGRDEHSFDHHRPDGDDGNVAPLDYVLANEEYLQQVVAHCETGETMLLATVDPHALMTIISQCDVLRRFRNHAFVQSYETLQVELEKYEFVKRSQDIRAKSVARYSELLYKYCLWRECVLKLKDQLLPYDLVVAPYETPNDKSFVAPKKRNVLLKLIDLDESSVSILRKAVSACQCHRSRANDNDDDDEDDDDDNGSSSGGGDGCETITTRDECAVLFGMINDILAIDEHKYTTYMSAIPPNTIYVPYMNDRVTTAASTEMLRELVAFEDSSITAAAAATAVTTATNLQKRQKRSRRVGRGSAAATISTVHWPIFPERSIYEMIGLKFAALCTVVPIPPEPDLTSLDWYGTSFHRPTDDE